MRTSPFCARTTRQIAGEPALGPLSVVSPVVSAYGGLTVVLTEKDSNGPVANATVEGVRMLAEGSRTTCAVDDYIDYVISMLHLLGVDHERLTYLFQGRRYRLTDVHGKVVQALLA